jgi:hypothetical protein
MSYARRWWWAKPILRRSDSRGAYDLAIDRDRCERIKVCSSKNNSGGTPRRAGGSASRCLSRVPRKGEPAACVRAGTSERQRRSRRPGLQPWVARKAIGEHLDYGRRYTSRTNHVRRSFEDVSPQQRALDLVAGADADERSNSLGHLGHPHAVLGRVGEEHQDSYAERDRPAIRWVRGPVAGGCAPQSAAAASSARLASRTVRRLTPSACKSSVSEGTLSPGLALLQDDPLKRADCRRDRGTQLVRLAGWPPRAVYMAVQRCLISSARKRALEQGCAKPSSGLPRRSDAG